MINVHIHLFGKPEWEFQGVPNVDEIKSKGDELKMRLYDIADAVKKLTNKGWEYDMTLYDLYFTKDMSEEEAKVELSTLGISEEIYSIDEYEEE